LDPKWYLVKTKPLNENRVFTRLAGAGYECLFPRIRKKSRRTGRSDIRPFFPTYLFVRFALEQLRTIRYTHGVSKVVSFGPEPQEVEAGIVDAVRGRMDDEGSSPSFRNRRTGNRARRSGSGRGLSRGSRRFSSRSFPTGRASCSCSMRCRVSRWS
jgi:transcriptional antiterminator RfaH